ncbi:MAG TPA: hypothetical protein VGB92_23450 [Longimicrobium sp.]|jgi:hypothetical protein
MPTHLERTRLRATRLAAAAALLLTAVPAIAQSTTGSTGNTGVTQDTTPAVAEPTQNVTPPVTTPGTTPPAPTPPKPTGASAVAELRVVSVTPESNRLGRHINVTVQNLDTLLREGRVSPDSFVLFVDGRPVRDAPARLVGPTGTVLSARLEYTTASSEAWLAAFEPIQKGVRIRGPVRIGVGYASGREAPWARDPVMLQFEPYTQLRFVSTIAMVLATLALLAWLTLRHELLRDASAPSELPLARRPFSLARTQAAAWFFAIFASFMYVRLVTGHFENVLNPQALLLLGLSIATQAASRAVDTNRRDSTQEALDELRPQQAELETQVQALKPAVDNLKATVDPAAKLIVAATHTSRTHELGSVTRRIAQAQAVLRGSRSENFLLDLVSDGAGVSLHRVQMAAWTVVLIGIYLTQVYFTLVLPTLSATLVGLMGLSSVAYVGLKPGESQPNPPTPHATAGDPAVPGGTPPQREEVVKVLGMVGAGASSR